MRAVTQDLLTTREVAQHRGVHVSTVQRWVAKGILTPAKVLPGNRRTGAYLFDLADVERLAKGRAA